jgi:hypothetical protein
MCSQIPPISLPLVVAATALLTISRAWADPIAPSTEANSAVHATWTTKQLHFVYMGFTAHYSCEGLADKVRKALLDLGARKDLKVREGACEHPFGGPEPFPNVDVKMSVLQPATDKTAATDTVPVHWKPVDLKLDRDPLWEAEDCELLEQIEHTFLPLFTTRNVDFHSTCAAHQVFPGGTWLRADVLAADPKAETKPVAAR